MGRSLILVSSTTTYLPGSRFPSLASSASTRAGFSRRFSGAIRSRIKPGQGLAVAHGEFAEVLVLRDQNAMLLDAERGELLVARASVALEHVAHVVARSAKRCDEARIAALVDQQLHGSARITASSAR